jgi:PIN domain nuclease of toxin-antitoxin system
MKLLLDTQAFLGWIGSGRPLTKTAAAAIGSDASDCLVSHVTAWEIAIKLSIGKLRLGPTLEEFYLRHTTANRFQQLPIALGHIARLTGLHARRSDPFDRLLAAQALEERLAIVSGDAVFDAYGVERIW